MKVKMRGIIPVQQKDGTWDVISKETEEDIPDLGREHLMCNICGFGPYPECMKNCTAYLPQTMKNRRPANN